MSNWKYKQGYEFLMNYILQQGVDTEDMVWISKELDHIFGKQRRC